MVSEAQLHIEGVNNVFLTTHRISVLPETWITQNELYVAILWAFEVIFGWIVSLIDWIILRIYLKQWKQLNKTLFFMFLMTHTQKKKNCFHRMTVWRLWPTDIRSVSFLDRPVLQLTSHLFECFPLFFLQLYYDNSYNLLRHIHTEVHIHTSY